MIEIIESEEDADIVPMGDLLELWALAHELHLAIDDGQQEEAEAIIIAIRDLIGFDEIETMH